MTTNNKLFTTIVFFIFISIISFTLERTLILTTILNISEYSYKEIMALYFMGLRFDVKIILTFLMVFYLPYIFISLMIFKNHKKIITMFNYILLLIFIFFIIMGFVNYGYYSVMGDHIDIMIFDLVDDGFFPAFYAMLFNLEVVFLFVLLLIAIIISVSFFLKQKNDFNIINSSSVSLLMSFVVSVIMVYIFAPQGGSAKSSLSRTTNNSNVNVVINELALNSVMYLYYANKDRKGYTFNLSSKQILKDMNVSNTKDLEFLAGYSKTNPLIKQTAKQNEDLPNIIFILMEGFSSHINLKHNNKTNNILGEFNVHKNEDYFNNLVFSNESYTNVTLERLLLNSPIHHLSVSKGKNISFDTSNVLVFKNAGYATEFIYGGHRSWKLIGNFYLKQGFDRFYSQNHIEDFTKRKSKNYWGAYDGDLFKFLKHRLETRTNKPTFSFILTTTNHDDVVLPENFKSKIFDLSVYGKKQSVQNQKILNGYFYSTNQLGIFLTWLKSSSFAKNTIVVATGDHTRKGFKSYISDKEAFYKHSIPLYFYIPKKYKQLNNKILPMSHIDIFPTLFDLSLNEKKYFAFGDSLLSNTNKRYGYNVHNIKNINVIIKNGVINNHSFYNFKIDNTFALEKKKTKLNQYQKSILSTIKYKEALAKYMIAKNFEISDVATTTP